MFLLIKILLVIVRVNCLDRAVFCDVELCELNASLVIASAREFRVMIEQIPFAVDLYDGVVRRPADYGFHKSSLISERSLRIIAFSIAEIMGRTC